MIQKILLSSSQR